MCLIYISTVKTEPCDYSCSALQMHTDDVSSWVRLFHTAVAWCAWQQLVGQWLKDLTPNTEDCQFKFFSKTKRTFERNLIWVLRRDKEDVHWWMQCFTEIFRLQSGNIFYMSRKKKNNFVFLRLDQWSSTTGLWHIRVSWQIVMCAVEGCPISLHCSTFSLTANNLSLFQVWNSGRQNN